MCYVCLRLSSWNQLGKSIKGSNDQISFNQQIRLGALDILFAGDWKRIERERDDDLWKVSSHDGFSFRVCSSPILPLHSHLPGHSEQWVAPAGQCYHCWALCQEQLSGLLQYHPFSCSVHNTQLLLRSCQWRKMDCQKWLVILNRGG